MAVTAFTEFYVNSSTGSQLNSGSSSGSPLLSVSNGNWSTSTNKFTVSAGTSLDSAWIGQFASVFLDAASVGVYISRITAIDDTLHTVTLSTTAKVGTAPTTGTTGRSLRIGGALLGPQSPAYSVWPMNNTTLSSATNASGDLPRFNLVGTAFQTLASWSLSKNVVFQGMTSTPGDGGRALISCFVADKGMQANDTSGRFFLKDLDITGDTNSSASVGVSCGNAAISLRCERVRTYNCGGGGFAVTAGSLTAVECEAYNIYAPGVAGSFSVSSGVLLLERCFAHPVYPNVHGVYASGGTLYMQDCICASGKAYGLHVSNASALVRNCVFHDNGNDETHPHGINVGTIASGGYFICTDSIFTDNFGWGVLIAGNANRNIILAGNASHNNTAGAFSYTAGQVMEVASVELSESPYVAASTGDYRTRTTSLRGRRPGGFLQEAGYATPARRMLDVGIGPSNPWFNGG